MHCWRKSITIQFRCLADLRRQDYNTWLQSSVPEAAGLLETYPETAMVTHPVAPYVNHLEFDELRLIYPAA